MSETVAQRLRRLQIELPRPSLPGANYVPYARCGSFLFLTGQLSQWNGERRFIGRLGREFDLVQGRQAARLAALNVVAHLQAALQGDLERVVRILKLGVFVNATEDFTQHAQVADGASDLFVELFGEAGRHSRLAMGVAGLPYGVALEVEAAAEVR